jgi:hypothetical protein
VKEHLMPARSRLSSVLVALALGALVATATPAFATQAAGAGPPRLAAQPQPPPIPNFVVDGQDAQRTRDAFTELLQKYPPALGRVLKLDPTLLANPAYIAPYPALVTFLQQHPEVVRNSSYFLEPVSSGGGYYPDERIVPAERMWERLTDGIGFLVIFGTFASLFAWILKMLVDYRRWNKLAKVQADAHTKLLDRFTANDELVAYVQSAAGSQFLQSAPIALDPGSRRLSAPYSRILWSVQAGLVITMGGAGLQWVSRRLADESSQPIYALGVLAMMIGLGFLLSAAAAYFLSQRLGLFTSPGAPGAPAGRIGVSSHK